MSVSIVTRLSLFHQKENKATQNGGLIFFHHIQQILNPDFILETKTFHFKGFETSHLPSFAKELLRHITGNRRGQVWKETRKEAWKQETFKGVS